MPPLDPCGLAVDRMRFPVVTWMRFYRDDPTLYRVRYYVVPEDTPYHPAPGPFRSRLAAKDDEVNWSFGEVFPSVLGEDFSSKRTRTGGGLPPGVLPARPGDPITFCGRPDAWLNGCITGVDFPCVHGEGLPTCCGNRALAVESVTLSHGVSLMGGA